MRRLHFFRIIGQKYGKAYFLVCNIELNSFKQTSSYERCRIIFVLHGNAVADRKMSPSSFSMINEVTETSSPNQASINNSTIVEK